MVKGTRNSFKQAFYFPDNYLLCEIVVCLWWVVFREETESS